MCRFAEKKNAWKTEKARKSNFILCMQKRRSTEVPRRSHEGIFVCDEMRMKRQKIQKHSTAFRSDCLINKKKICPRAPRSWKIVLFCEVIHIHYDLITAWDNLRSWNFLSYFSFRKSSVKSHAHYRTLTRLLSI